jgi:hypothetical protein
LSGFQQHARLFGDLKTAKAVDIPSVRATTPLKRGVNKKAFTEEI